MTDTAIEIAKARDLIRSSGRAIRERAGISQSELARDLGVDTTTVSRWEDGRRRPRGPAAVKYAQLLRKLSQVAL